MTNDKIPTKTWIGWALTICLSAATAYTSVNARVYDIEKEIEVIKTRVDINEKAYDKQLLNYERQSQDYNEIKASLVRIEGSLNTKADKQYR